MEQRTYRVVSTALLGALVIVFDYTLKFSGLKIPFPWFPALKFDLTGIPIMLALFLYGVTSGVTTSSIAFLGILLRSGDVIGSSMKAIAELSTVLGMAPFINRMGAVGRLLSIGSGLIVRVVIMSIMNVITLPMFYSQYYTFETALLFLPLLAVFNVMQGSISIFGGITIYQAIRDKLPQILKA